MNDISDDSQDEEEMPPICPFCNLSGDGCPHFLGIIDRSYGEIVGDYKLLKAFIDVETDEIEDYTPHLDKICSICEDLCTTVSYSSPGGPRMCSAEIWIWSQSPDETIETIRARFNEITRES